MVTSRKAELLPLQCDIIFHLPDSLHLGNPRAAPQTTSQSDLFTCGSHPCWPSWLPCRVAWDARSAAFTCQETRASSHCRPTTAENTAGRFCAPYRFPFRELPGIDEGTRRFPRYLRHTVESGKATAHSYCSRCSIPHSVPLHLKLSAECAASSAAKMAALAWASLIAVVLVVSGTSAEASLDATLTVRISSFTAIRKNLFQLSLCQSLVACSFLILNFSFIRNLCDYETHVI